MSGKMERICFSLRVIQKMLITQYNVFPSNFPGLVFFRETALVVNNLNLLEFFYTKPTNAFFFKTSFDFSS